MRHFSTHLHRQSQSATGSAPALDWLFLVFHDDDEKQLWLQRYGTLGNATPERLVPLSTWVRLHGPAFGLALEDAPSPSASGSRHGGEAVDASEQGELLPPVVFDYFTDRLACLLLDSVTLQRLIDNSALAHETAPAPSG